MKTVLAVLVCAMAVLAWCVFGTFLPAGCAIAGDAAASEEETESPADAAAGSDESYKDDAAEAAAGHETSDEAGQVAWVEVSDELSDLFSRRCISCHGSSGAAGLSLEPEGLVVRLVGVASTQVDTVALVAPGDPDASYLVMKVKGVEGIVGKRMPLGGKPLSDEEIALKEDWIAALALPDTSKAAAPAAEGAEADDEGTSDSEAGGDKSSGGAAAAGESNDAGPGTGQRTGEGLEETRD